MVQYLHFRILEFPLKWMSESVGSYTLYIDGKVLAQIAHVLFPTHFLGHTIPYGCVTIFRGEMTHDQNTAITGMVYLPIPQLHSCTV